jgi:heptaprenyl diphosphate synthase
MPQRIDDRQLAFFGAFCLFLSTIEFLIPKPLPFMRIGFANLPLLLSLRLYSPRFTLALCVLKITGQGIIGGTLFSYIFLFSTAGSLASAVIMIGCSRVFGEKMSLAGISVLGSLASNITQIVFARYFLLGEGAYLIAPPFLAAGTVAGLLLGIFAQGVFENSKWMRNPDSQSAGYRAGGCRIEECESGAATARLPVFWAICGLLAVCPFLFIESLRIKLVLCALFVFLTLLSGRKIRILPNIVLAFSVIFCHLLTPSGKIYFSLGNFPVTEDALLRGIGKTVTVIGLVYLSRLAIRPSLRLWGRPGRIFTAMIRYFELITESMKLPGRHGRAGTVFRSGQPGGTGKNKKIFWSNLDAVFEKIWHKGFPA